MVYNQQTEDTKTAAQTRFTEAKALLLQWQQSAPNLFEKTWHLGQVDDPQAAKSLALGELPTLQALLQPVTANRALDLVEAQCGRLKTIFGVERPNVYRSCSEDFARAQMPDWSILEAMTRFVDKGGENFPPTAAFYKSLPKELQDLRLLKARLQSVVDHDFSKPFTEETPKPAAKEKKRHPSGHDECLVELRVLRTKMTEQIQADHAKAAEILAMAKGSPNTVEGKKDIAFAEETAQRLRRPWPQYERCKALIEWGEQGAIDLTWRDIMALHSRPQWEGVKKRASLKAAKIAERLTA